ncbi:gustatory receptor-like 40a isoform 2-T2 [Cochliomyia hominivorax]
MNLERIIRITSGYLFLTGYHIRWYDCKSLHYRLTIWAIPYFLIIYLIYLICLCHHFERSAMLKIFLDISPFLSNLVRMHVLLGLKVFIFCLIEWKDLTKIFNNLIRLTGDAIKREKSFDRWEGLVYLIFFSTLMVVLGIGLYIAIEMNFELPPMDHIMIAMALFIPHFTLAGCLRLYSLGLWLIGRELEILTKYLKDQEKCENRELITEVVIEIVNPVLRENSINTNLSGFYGTVCKRLEVIVDFMKLFESVLQRQLGVLIGLNFNCILAGAYGRVYFANSWYILFTQRNRRIFYASNSAIFICILMDYAILLAARWYFDRKKAHLYNLIKSKLCGSSVLLAEIEKNLRYIKHLVSKDIKLKLFGLVDFNTWNFLMLQGLMLLIIALINEINTH